MSVDREVQKAARGGLREVASSRLSHRGHRLLLLSSVVVLVLVSCAALLVGAVHVSPSTLLTALLWPHEVDVPVAEIVRELRLPRVLSCALVGGGLAMIGATLQSIMRNPLADPYVLGISSGASVGAVFASGLSAWVGAAAGPRVSLLLDVVRALGPTGAAFVTALLSVWLVYAAGKSDGRLPPVRLLLAGIAYSSLAGALTALLLYLLPEAAEMRGLVFWLLGGFSSADWRSLAWMAALIVPALFVLWLSARWQNLLLLGDEPALALGLDVRAARVRLIVVTALATGAIVAHSGAVGFVGLIVPHAVRPFTGPDLRRLFPLVFLVGATFLVLVDAVSRTILAPQDLPLGILTGLLGGPFFLAMLRRTGAQHAS